MIWHHEIPRAVLSEDGFYRYFLSRQWGHDGKRVAFIGLNPSVADAENDDPTIRRCVGFAKMWGGTSLWMVNLFAYRSTKPDFLRIVPDPVGPENDAWLERVILSADLVVAAWGNHGKLLGRGAEVENCYRDRLHRLAVTKLGMPKHPLYLSSDLWPVKMVS